MGGQRDGDGPHHPSSTAVATPILSCLRREHRLDCRVAWLAQSCRIQCKQGRGARADDGHGGGPPDSTGSVSMLSPLGLRTPRGCNGFLPPPRIPKRSGRRWRRGSRPDASSPQTRSHTRSASWPVPCHQPPLERSWPLTAAPSRSSRLPGRHVAENQSHNHSSALQAHRTCLGEGSAAARRGSVNWDSAAPESAISTPPWTRPRLEKRFGRRGTSGSGGSTPPRTTGSDCRSGALAPSWLGALAVSWW